MILPRCYRPGAGPLRPPPPPPSPPCLLMFKPPRFSFSFNAGIGAGMVICTGARGRINAGRAGLPVGVGTGLIPGNRLPGADVSLSSANINTQGYRMSTHMQTTRRMMIDHRHHPSNQPSNNKTYLFVSTCKISISAASHLDYRLIAIAMSIFSLGLQTLCHPRLAEHEFELPWCVCANENNI